MHVTVGILFNVCQLVSNINPIKFIMASVGEMGNILRLELANTLTADSSKDVHSQKPVDKQIRSFSNGND